MENEKKRSSAFLSRDKASVTVTPNPLIPQMGLLREAWVTLYFRVLSILKYKKKRKCQKKVTDCSVISMLTKTNLMFLR